METFRKVLDPDDASTGGGSASAIAGAMAGALVAMAARLSDSTEAPEKDFYERIYTQARQVSQQLLDGGEEDALAFQAVRSAYQLPRQTDEAKNARQQAIQSAWLRAARVPVENAGRCLRVFELGAELADRVNPKVLSDLRCGLLLARAGLLGCLENVQINLPALKDEAIAAQLDEQARDLRVRLAGLEQIWPG